MSTISTATPSLSDSSSDATSGGNKAGVWNKASNIVSACSHRWQAEVEYSAKVSLAMSALLQCNYCIANQRWPSVNETAVNLHQTGARADLCQCIRPLHDSANTNGRHRACECCIQLLQDQLGTLRHRRTAQSTRLACMRGILDAGATQCGVGGDDPGNPNLFGSLGNTRDFITSQVRRNLQ